MKQFSVEQKPNSVLAIPGILSQSCKPALSIRAGLVFSKKIEAAQAQRGFFVARSFTKFAEAAAKIDPRIVLLQASDNFINSGMIDRFHSIFVDFSKSRLDINFVGKSSKIPGFLHKSISIETSVAKLNGSIIELRNYVPSLHQKVIEEHSNQLQTQTFPEGEYKYDFTREISLEPNSLIIDDAEIEKLLLRVQYEVAVVRPPVVSKFQIQSRGRVYTFDKVRVGNQEIPETIIIETFPQTSQ